MIITFVLFIVEMSYDIFCVLADVLTEILENVGNCFGVLSCKIVWKKNGAKKLKNEFGFKQCNVMLFLSMHIMICTVCSLVCNVSVTTYP